MIKYRTDKRFKFMILFMCILMIGLSCVPMMMGTNVVSAVTIGDNDILIDVRGISWFGNENAKLYASNSTNKDWVEVSKDSTNTYYVYTLPSNESTIKIARNSSTPGGNYDSPSAWNYSEAISVGAGQWLYFTGLGTGSSTIGSVQASFGPGESICFDTGANKDTWSKSGPVCVNFSESLNPSDSDNDWTWSVHQMTEDPDHVSKKDADNGHIFKYTFSQRTWVRYVTNSLGGIDSSIEFANTSDGSIAYLKDSEGRRHNVSFQYNINDVRGKVAFYDSLYNSDPKRVKLSFYDQSSMSESFDASGRTLYVVDMTGTLKNKTVTCTYKDSSNNINTGSYTAVFDANGNATITIPPQEVGLGKWKTMTLVCDGKTLISDAVLKELDYTINNTYYYGATTDQSDVAQYSYWNSVRGTASEKNGTLYFERSSFGKEKTVTVNGTTAAVNSDDSHGNYSHNITLSNNTTNSIITADDGTYKYHFYWDSSNDLVTVYSSTRLGAVTGVHDEYESRPRRVYFDASLSKLSYQGTIGNEDYREMPPRAGSYAGKIYAALYKADGTKSRTVELTKSSDMTGVDPNHTDYGTRTFTDLYYVDATADEKYVMFYCGSEPSDKLAIVGEQNKIRYVTSDSWTSVNLYIFDEDSYQKSHNTGRDNMSIEMVSIGNNAFEITKTEIDAAINAAAAAGGYSGFVDPQIIFRKGGTTGTVEGDSTTNTYQEPRIDAGGYQLIYGGVYGTKEKDTNINGTATERYYIPDSLTNPCFYADTSDATVYEGGRREGYWDEVCRIRDAEAGKVTDTVDIATKRFTQAAETKYIPSTFYDYYSDFEMNGFNRKKYNVNANGASQKNWVTFRQFDQALSDYYRDASVDIPIYSGHFQPTYSDWGCQFKDIASTMDLYGWADPNSGTNHGSTGKSQYNWFISTNNSNVDIDGNSGNYACLTQGLVNSQTDNGKSTGNIMTSDGKAVLPYFNKEFLLGNNSKNAIIGEVYENVSFPFKEVEDSEGVSYWTFDSACTTLAFLRDPGDNHYYLESKGERNAEVPAATTVSNDNLGWSYNVNSKGTNAVDEDNKISTKYGFYPFNYGYSKSKEARGSTYNFCFGTSMNFSFITSTGLTKKKSGSSDDVHIKFKFSGDDDIWVFIDGNLELDMGGDHGRCTGEIDFYDGTWSVNNVKESAGHYSTTNNGSLTKSYKDGKKHTLTVYYMERGMWESNMKVQFNASLENSLTVEKEVNTGNVDSAFNSFSEYVKKNVDFPVDVSVLSTNNADSHDYGSESSGNLTAANGATYDYTKPNYSTTPVSYQTTTNQTLPSTGEFNLKHDELAHFANQFDTGDYMKITENVTGANANLFSTTWTLKEDNIDVTGYVNKTGRTVVDSRDEADYVTATSTHSKPAGNDTFLYRSYSKPKQEFVDLTVHFVNTVKTGSIQINKKQLTGSSDLNPNTTYQFLVKCWNIGGLSDNSAVTTPVWFRTQGIAKNGSVTISGIPAGTNYEIYEIDPVDGSKPKGSGGQAIAVSDLESVSYLQLPTKDTGSDTFNTAYLIHSSTVKADSTSSVNANNAIYLGDISVNKVWNLVNAANKKTQYVTVELQYSTDGSNWNAVLEDAYGTAINRFDLNDGNSWTHTFSNLFIKDSSGTDIQYRVVELDPATNQLITNTSTQTFNDCVNVSYSGNDVVLDQADAKSVTITNSFNNVIVMPETGGTPLIYLFPIGIIALVLSGAVVVIYRKKLQGASFFVKRKGRSD